LIRNRSRMARRYRVTWPGQLEFSQTSMISF